MQYSNLFKVQFILNFMKTYGAKIGEHEVFGANMTIDAQTDVYSASNLSACKSCQCNCRLCIGGKLPDDVETISKAETENVLEKLLAA